MRAEALSWIIWAMCGVMDGAGQVTPAKGPSDIDCRLTGIDRVALAIAETRPEGESLGG